MNTDILSGKWQQTKGKIKQQWSKLTPDDLVIIEGQQDELIELVQERYSYTAEQAELEVEEFLQKFVWEFKDSVADTVSSSK